MSVYKSKDGRWYYRCYYSDLLGNRKQKNSKMYDTKKECIQAEVQFKLDTSKTSAQSITIEQLMLNYIEESSRGNTKKTKNDKLHRMKYCESILNMKIDKITPSIMQRFKNEVDALPLGTARKNQILALCNSSFNYAIKFYGLQSNPMTFVDKIKETSEEKMREMNIYTGVRPSKISRSYTSMGYNVTAKSTGGEMQNLGGLVEKCFSGAKVTEGSAVKFGKSVSDASEMLVRKFGDNASGVCSVQFRTLTGPRGHAFNWSIKDGVVTFFDGQNPSSFINTNPELIWKKIIQGDPITLARLDNAAIIEEAIKAVVQ